LARQSRGLSQDALATKIGRTAGALSKMEHGIISTALPVAEEIASSLRYPIALFFRNERVRGTDSICFHHRKRQSMPVKLLTTVEAQMHMTQLQVSRLFEEVAAESPNQFLTLDPDEYEGSAERVAQILRSIWHLPRGPIRNLTQTLEAAGCIVVFRPFGTAKLDGMSCWARSAPPLFFINDASPTDRARWTLAHELGHLVMHATAPSNPEAQADAFAAEFLAPALDSEGDFRGLQFGQLPGLKAKWRISMSAIIAIASRRGLISEARTKSLWVQMSRSGFRLREPFPLTPEPPELLNQALRVHQDEHEYSADELAKLMDLYPEEFKTLYGKSGSSFGGSLSVI